MIQQSTQPVKSGFPYLVDIKISEYCPFACQFCYQSSTKEGKYADSSFLTHTLPRDLRAAGVFNICFGGGEPTLYKDTYNTTLDKILEAYRRHRFVVSFTTKNYNMYKLPNFVEIVKAANAIAISANTLEELEQAAELASKIRSTNYYCAVYVQTILELLPWDETLAWFKAATTGYRFGGITFLGYKSFGFGVNDTPNEVPDDWMNYFKQGNANVGIDSVLATKYKSQLIANGVEEYKLVGTDGVSTCYIDAVKKTVARNSFCNEVVPYSSKTFLQTFESF